MVWRIAIAVVLAAGPWACSGDSDGKANASGHDSGAQNFANAGDNTATGGSSGGGLGGGDNPPDPNCAGEVQGARQVPVDMYIMLDKSGSMLGETAAGPTKWEAILDALTAFVTDSESDGLGVGLQYFPLQNAGVPDTCTSDVQCGDSGGPCLNRACVPGPGAVDFTYCIDASYCAVQSPGCAVFGICEFDDRIACFDLGPGGCNFGGPDNYGDCVEEPSECAYCASCVPGDYSTPAVAIDLLPGNAQAIIDSLSAQTPRCVTPTSSALIGAIDRAAIHAAENPDHRVLVVLATDGTPTDCLPIDIREIAGIAWEGRSMANSILTYVIGVFTAEETDAQANLDLIADRGGTGRALIVDPAQDVAQQFVDALGEIRGGTLDCEFQLPAAPAGEELDYDFINVELTEGGMTSSLLYVENEGNCGQARLGWFYDQVPSASTMPTTIQVCPDTCIDLKAVVDGSVSIRLGCKTMGPE